MLFSWVLTAKASQRLRTEQPQMSDLNTLLCITAFLSSYQFSHTTCFPTRSGLRAYRRGGQDPSAADGGGRKVSLHLNPTPQKIKGCVNWPRVCDATRCALISPPSKGKDTLGRGSSPLIALGFRAFVMEPRGRRSVFLTFCSAEAL